MSSPRRDRVSDAVQAEVARLLQVEARDTRLGFITVTGVRMSSDLRHARVFVSFLAEGEEREKALQALGSLRGFIRKRLGQTLRLRYTPEIIFTLDDSAERGSHIDELISAGLPDAPEDEEDR
ncbi:MAG TPA: 30S ribosome-binding factor RbfA [Candidatus Polarisedimenticolia bacterium]|nr:30S ribosome-binding factor RbfA [Candidatus Polarisedimenticolia bacterium]